MSINSVGFTSNVVVRNSGSATRPAFSGEPAPIDLKDSEKKGFNSAAVLIGLAAAGAIAVGIYLKMGKPVQAEKLIKSTMPKLKKCTNFSDVKITAGKCYDKTGKPFTGKVLQPIGNDGKTFYVNRYSEGELVQSFTYLTRNGKTEVSEVVDGTRCISRDVKPDGFGSWRNRSVLYDDGVQARKLYQYKDGKIATETCLEKDGSKWVTSYQNGVKNFSEITYPDGSVKRLVYREGIESTPSVSLETGKRVVSKQQSSTVPYEVQSYKKLENGSIEISYTNQDGKVVRETINPN